MKETLPSLSPTNSCKALEAALKKVGINAKLQTPPQHYVAVLTSPTLKEPTSLTFRIPDTQAGEIGYPLVIRALLEKLQLGELLYGELTNSTLDYFLEQKMGENTHQAKINGKQIRYALKGDQNPRKSTPTWRYLPEETNIQFFKMDPFLIDDDPTTLQENLQRANAAIQESIETQKKILAAAQTKIEQLNALHASLNSSDDRTP
jgi:hypothetical protein